MGFNNKCLYLRLALIVLLGSLAYNIEATSRNLQDTSMLERHEEWMARHGIVYKNADEKAKRFEIFKENVARIEAFNRAANKPYKLGVNKFADLTNEEFVASRNRFKAHVCESRRLSGTPFKYENVTSVPKSLDWRKKGAVTPVKDQGQCGKIYYDLIT